MASDRIEKMALVLQTVVDIVRALEPLAVIAECWENNDLDEARRWHEPLGQDRVYSLTPPEAIELVQGRGGRRLLTLADCLEARRALDALGVSRRRG